MPLLLNRPGAVRRPGPHANPLPDCDARSISGNPETPGSIHAGIAC